MAQHKWIWLVTAILLSACAASQRNNRSPTVTLPLSPASLNQECGSLDADIAGARNEQRTQPPTSNQPVIAEAANAKADQRIEDLRLRYESLGCARVSASGEPEKSK